MFMIYILVRVRGLEPPRPLQPLEPKPSASTNYATPAHLVNSTERVALQRRGILVPPRGLEPPRPLLDPDLSNRAVYHDFSMAAKANRK